ncbi:MAG: hypothetical protein ACK5HY_07030, partial [Parahaliea sp.]
RRATLSAVAGGKTDAVAAAAALRELTASELLGQVVDYLQQYLRALSPAELSCSGRAAFTLLDELAGIQAAMAGGSNPNLQLLTEFVLVRLHQALGELSASANIR